SLADNKQRSLVFCIHLSIGTDRERSVSCAKREIQKQILPECSTLVDGIDIAIFTVGVHHSITVHHRCVDAPLEPNVHPLVSGTVGDTRDAAIRIASACLVVRALKLPLDSQVWIKLRDEERSIVARKTDNVHIAIRTELWPSTVFVVLDHYR